MQAGTGGCLVDDPLASKRPGHRKMDVKAASEAADELRQQADGCLRVAPQCHDDKRAAVNERIERRKEKLLCGGFTSETMCVIDDENIAPMNARPEVRRSARFEGMSQCNRQISAACGNNVRQAELTAATSRERLGKRRFSCTRAAAKNEWIAGKHFARSGSKQAADKSVFAPGNEALRLRVCIARGVIGRTKTGKRK
jgi:hypothetical protein